MKKYTLLLLPLSLIFSSLSYAEIHTTTYCYTDKVTGQHYCGPIRDGSGEGEG